MGNFHRESEVNPRLFFWLHLGVLNNNFGISGVYDYLNLGGHSMFYLLAPIGLFCFVLFCFF